VLILGQEYFINQDPPERKVQEMLAFSSGLLRQPSATLKLLLGAYLELKSWSN
jgi:hypothetical protein